MVFLHSAAQPAGTSKAKVLSRKRDSGLWDHLIQEEQYIVEAYDGGRLDRELQNLLPPLPWPIYSVASAGASAGAEHVAVLHGLLPPSLVCS